MTIDAAARRKNWAARRLRETPDHHVEDPRPEKRLTPDPTIIREAAGQLNAGKTEILRARPRGSLDDCLISGQSPPNGSPFRPIPGHARGAARPCGPGSSRNRQRRAVGLRVATPPYAHGSSQNRQQRGGVRIGGSSFGNSTNRGTLRQIGKLWLTRQATLSCPGSR